MKMKRTMSKRLAALAAITAALCLCAALPPGAAAESDALTMAQYRETVPDSVQFVIDGQTYDVPVTLPDEDTLPVIVTQMATFNSTDAHTVYPLRKGLPKYVREASLAWDYDGSPFLDFSQEASDGRLEGKADAADRAALPEGSAPPENDATVDDVMNLIQTNLLRFDCDVQPDLRVLRATAMSGLYRMKKVKASDGTATWTEYAVDDTKPVKNAGKGSWELAIAQYLHGAQIFAHYDPYGRYNPPAEAGEWYSHYDIYAHYMDVENFNIHLGLAKETGVVKENADLLPFDRIVESIRQRIDEGKLKSIYGLTLGYSVKIAKGDAFWAEKMDFNNNCRFVLVPEWRILGYDLKDYSNTNVIGYSQPDREAILDPGHASPYGLNYELRLDAATGEPVLDYAAMKYDLNGAQ